MSAGAPPDRPGADPERLRDALAGGAPGERVEVRETHISWVFLVGERAYKLKKPVVLDFLDYGTPARRHAMCREEVRLNARLAPELYLAVRAVADRAGRLEIGDESDPDAVDYVVEMRRYDERATLAALADAGRITPGQAATVGGRLAAFHAGCAARNVAPGSQTVRHELQENLSELMDACGDRPMAARIAALGRFLDAFAAANRAMLDARARRGLIREVHGDLRAEHVIMAPRLAIVDCVEFDPDLRTLDVADDLAFLVIDLCAHRAETAAHELIGAYRRSGGDCRLGRARVVLRGAPGAHPGQGGARARTAGHGSRRRRRRGDRLPGGGRSPLALEGRAPPRSSSVACPRAGSRTGRLHWLPGPAVR